jgi:hypothetical protein
MANRSAMPFQTEVDFTLPKGFIDEFGTVHRNGAMRLATAADEILPLRDPRVQQNEAYLAVIVLARVVTRLGDLPVVDTRVVEGLFASDMVYLQRLYEDLNRGEGDGASVPMVHASNGMPRDAAPLAKGFRVLGEA